MPEITKPIAESNRFIVLEKYTKEWEAAEGYQTEADLERELIQDLRNQGYEFLPDVITQEAMLANVCAQLQTLNNVQFSESEWLRFVETYLDSPRIALPIKPVKSTMIISMILSLMMAIFKIFTCLIKRILPAIRFSS